MLDLYGTTISDIGRGVFAERKPERRKERRKSSERREKDHHYHPPHREEHHEEHSHQPSSSTTTTAYSFARLEAEAEDKTSTSIATPPTRHEAGEIALHEAEPSGVEKRLVEKYAGHREHEKKQEQQQHGQQHVESSTSSSLVCRSTWNLEDLTQSIKKSIEGWVEGKPPKKEIEEIEKENLRQEGLVLVGEGSEQRMHIQSTPTGVSTPTTAYRFRQVEAQSPEYKIDTLIHSLREIEKKYHVDLSKIIQKLEEARQVLETSANVPDMVNTAIKYAQFVVDVLRSGKILYKTPNALVVSSGGELHVIVLSPEYSQMKYILQSEEEMKRYITTTGVIPRESTIRSLQYLKSEEKNIAREVEKEVHSAVSSFLDKYFGNVNAEAKKLEKLAGEIRSIRERYGIEFREDKKNNEIAVTANTEIGRVTVVIESGKIVNVLVNGVPVTGEERVKALRAFEKTYNKYRSQVSPLLQEYNRVYRQYVKARREAVEKLAKEAGIKVVEKNGKIELNTKIKITVLSGSDIVSGIENILKGVINYAENLKLSREELEKRWREFKSKYLEHVDIHSLGTREVEEYQKALGTFYRYALEVGDYSLAQEVRRYIEKFNEQSRYASEVRQRIQHLLNNPLTSWMVPLAQSVSTIARAIGGAVTEVVKALHSIGLVSEGAVKSVEETFNNINRFWEVASREMASGEVKAPKSFIAQLSYNIGAGIGGFIFPMTELPAELITLGVTKLAEALHLKGLEKAGVKTLEEAYLASAGRRRLEWGVNLPFTVPILGIHKIAVEDVAPFIFDIAGGLLELAGRIAGKAGAVEIEDVLRGLAHEVVRAGRELPDIKLIDMVLTRLGKAGRKLLNLIGRIAEKEGKTPEEVLAERLGISLEKAREVYSSLEKNISKLEEIDRLLRGGRAEIEAPITRIERTETGSFKVEVTPEKVRVSARAVGLAQLAVEKKTAVRASREAEKLTETGLVAVSSGRGTVSVLPRGEYRTTKAIAELAPSLEKSLERLGEEVESIRLPTMYYVKSGRMYIGSELLRHLYETFIENPELRKLVTSGIHYLKRLGREAEKYLTTGSVESLEEIRNIAKKLTELGVITREEAEKLISKIVEKSPEAVETVTKILEAGRSRLRRRLLEEASERYALHVLTIGKEAVKSVEKGLREVERLTSEVESYLAGSVGEIARELRSGKSLVEIETPVLRARGRLVTTPTREEVEKTIRFSLETLEKLRREGKIGEEAYERIATGLRNALQASSPEEAVKVVREEVLPALEGEGGMEIGKSLSPLFVSTPSMEIMGEAEIATPLSEVNIEFGTSGEEGAIVRKVRKVVPLSETEIASISEENIAQISRNIEKSLSKVEEEIGVEKPLEQFLNIASLPEFEGRVGIEIGKDRIEVPHPEETFRNLEVLGEKLRTISRLGRQMENVINMEKPRELVHLLEELGRELEPIDEELSKSAYKLCKRIAKLAESGNTEELMKAVSEARRLVREANELLEEEMYREAERFGKFLPLEERYRFYDNVMEIAELAKSGREDELLERLGKLRSEYMEKALPRVETIVESELANVEQIEKEAERTTSREASSIEKSEKVTTGKSLTVEEKERTSTPSRESENVGKSGEGTVQVSVSEEKPEVSRGVEMGRVEVSVEEYSAVRPEELNIEVRPEIIRLGRGERIITQGNNVYLDVNGKTIPIKVGDTYSRISYVNGRLVFYTATGEEIPIREVEKIGEGEYKIVLDLGSGRDVELVLHMPREVSITVPVKSEIVGTERKYEVTTVASGRALINIEKRADIDRAVREIERNVEKLFTSGMEILVTGLENLEILLELLREVSEELERELNMELECTIEKMESGKYMVKVRIVPALATAVAGGVRGVPPALVSIYAPSWVTNRIRTIIHRAYSRYVESVPAVPLAGGNYPYTYSINTSFMLPQETFSLTEPIISEIPITLTAGGGSGSGRKRGGSHGGEGRGRKKRIGVSGGIGLAPSGGVVLPSQVSGEELMLFL